MCPICHEDHRLSKCPRWIIGWGTDMSLDLYTTGVQYARGRYLALKYHGRMLFSGKHDLRNLPSADAVHYYPEVGVSQLRQIGSTESRLMLPSEVALLDTLLRRISKFPRLLERSRKWLMK